MPYINVVYRLAYSICLIPTKIRCTSQVSSGLYSSISPQTALEFSPRTIRLSWGRMNWNKPFLKAHRFFLSKHKMSDCNSWKLLGRLRSPKSKQNERSPEGTPNDPFSALREDGRSWQNSLYNSAHELLHRTLASLEFSNDLAHDGKHRHAPVVNLLTRLKACQ